MISAVIFMIAIVGYYTIGKQHQSAILMLLSLYVYWEVASWNILIIASLALLVGSCASLLTQYKSKLLVIIPILLLLTGFILLRGKWIGMVFPLGYSVLSFTSISLLVDQYRKPIYYRFIDAISYLLFFPKIFAGPIERAHDFIDSEVKVFNLPGFYIGLKYLIFASFCKFIIGDMIASTDMSGMGINLWMQSLIYAIDFFFDFWSYTLMALGIGKLFGYDLSISFLKPYSSTSFRVFWHHWNITLGTWLRDYIYIPLGGNRQKRTAWSGSILLVFVISALWHGVSWPFLIWGLCHGCLLIFERLCVKPERFSGVIKVLYSCVIVIIVCLLWQLFIVDTSEEIYERWIAYSGSQHISVRTLLQLMGCILSYIFFTNDKVFSLVDKSSESNVSIIAEVSLLSVMITVLLVLNCPLSFNFFYFRF